MAGAGDAHQRLPCGCDGDALLHPRAQDVLPLARPQNHTQHRPRWHTGQLLVDRII
jgi:hypothetical protein